LQKFASSAHILEKEDLIKLFYEIYNEDTEVNIEQMQAGADAPLIRGENKA
jgi:FKBP-type peptidyl-prolyl cis-trans isomerase 2